jgi:hypothetical protein
MVKIDGGGRGVGYSGRAWALGFGTTSIAAQIRLIGDAGFKGARGGAIWSGSAIDWSCDDVGLID